MFSALKNRTMALARSPHAERGLFALAFAESSFFPLPPDIVLGPMAAAEPTKWLRYGLVCAAGSVLGAILGYAIGFFAAETLGHWILSFFGLEDRLEHFRELYGRWGAWIILGQGLLPVPYKFVTIASGIFAFSLPVLIGCSMLTRTTRFLAVAFVFQKFGPQIAPILEKRLGVAIAVIAVVIIGAVLALRFVH